MHRPATSPLAIAGWVVAVFASGAAIAGWMREPSRDEPIPRAEPASTTAPVSPEEPPATTARLPEMGALRACVTALRGCETRCPETPGESPEAHEARTLRCLADPGVQSHVARSVESACAGCADGSRAARDAEDRARTEAAASFLERELAITPDEQEQLGEYLCAIRDARGMLARADEGAEGGRATYESAREIRELTLGDVESILGAERYARLRAVGGLGLMVESADCQAPGAGAGIAP